MMMNASKHSPNTELRSLPAAQRHRLIGLLDVNDNWKTLATVLPNPDRPDQLLLKATNIAILDEQRKRPAGSPAGALLEYWGTYGRRRHTLGDAIRFLKHVGLDRAADVVQECFENPLINIEPPMNPIKEGSTLVTHNWNDLPVYTSFVEDKKKFLLAHDDRNLNVQPSAPNESLISFNTDVDSHSQQSHLSTKQKILMNFDYKSLQLATDGFSQQKPEDGGSKLGEGAFGEVFRCATILLNNEVLCYSKFVAVKRFKEIPVGNDKIENQVEDKKMQFLTELKTMYHFQHPNLVKLFGYSNDGPFLCIITEYLENGSLQRCLFGSDKNQLNFRIRSQIALDVASAIVYLHTYTSVDKNGNLTKKPFIHRDIKSANILLDRNFCARLGDLGLVRQGSSSNTQTTKVTETVKGTSAYMAPEAFRGDVSVKTDTFSYGVVLLELFTGCAAFDFNREEPDIISHFDSILGDNFDQLSYLDIQCKDLITLVEESFKMLDLEKLTEILDSNVKDQTFQPTVGQKLIILAKCCVKERKRQRPTMVEVQKLLDHLKI